MTGCPEAHFSIRLWKIMYRRMKDILKVPPAETATSSTSQITQLSSQKAELILTERVRYQNHQLCCRMNNKQQKTGIILLRNHHKSTCQMRSHIHQFLILKNKRKLSIKHLVTPIIVHKYPTAISDLRKNQVMKIS